MKSITGKVYNETDYPEQELTGQIIGAAIEVHRNLGAGLLESAYLACLEQEFLLRKIPYEKEKPVKITYKGLDVEASYRLDFLVDRRVVVELKAVDTLLPIHRAQVATYLRLSGVKIGLLINFNVEKLVDGLVRIIA